MIGEGSEQQRCLLRRVRAIGPRYLGGRCPDRRREGRAAVRRFWLGARKEIMGRTSLGEAICNILVETTPRTRRSSVQALRRPVSVWLGGQNSPADFISSPQRHEGHKEASHLISDSWCPWRPCGCGLLSCRGNN